MLEHDSQLDVCREKWKQVDMHLEESVPVRDRLNKLEIKVDYLEKGVLRNAIIGGVIGALVGSGSPHAIEFLMKALV